jgi:hypothetical protein
LYGEKIRFAVFSVYVLGGWELVPNLDRERNLRAATCFWSIEFNFLFLSSVLRGKLPNCWHEIGASWEGSTFDRFCKGVWIMETHDIFIGTRKDVVITCPECGRKKTADLSNIKYIRKKVRLTCTCGASFSAKFEKRVGYRKTVFIDGYFSAVDPGAPLGRMTIINLSKGGLGFRTIGRCDVKEGDILNVQFNLDNDQRTLIRQSVIVRYVTDDYVGVAFCDLDEGTQKSLGFYLMP